MARKLALVGLTALVLAGCGSSSSPATSPASTELSYFPTNTPFVMTVATDPNSGSVQAAQGLVARFPEAALGIDALKAKLTQVGLSYDADIHPLFGKPIAIGFTTAAGFSTGSAQSAVLIVWETDTTALKAIFKKLGGISSTGTRDGATLYQLGAETLAIDGGTAVLGESATVNAALDRHAHGGGFTSQEYATYTSGLPQGALIEAVGSLTGVLSSPSTATARQIPWVAAIRGYGAAINITSSGVSFSYRVDTSGGSLTSSQVPIAAGTTAPSLTGNAPIVAGIHDPAQIVTFAEAAAKAVSPTSYAKFQEKLAKAEQHGIDLNALASQLTGDLIINSDEHTTIGRVSVTNPSAVSQQLAKFASLSPHQLGGGKGLEKGPGSFYTIPNKSGGIRVGVVGNQLVAGNATPAQLSAFAAAPTTPSTFAHGSVAFRISLLDLLHMSLKTQPPAVVATLLNDLGDITGWAASSTSALSGSAALGIK